MPSTVDADRLDELPPPVARYFAFALSPAQRIISRAHFRFRGAFAAKPDAWAPFMAQQDVRAQPPGFVWDARIAMMPVVPVRVRDSYVGGEGSMRAAFSGLIPVVNQHGTPEMAAASLQRFLAEAGLGSVEAIRGRMGHPPEPPPAPADDADATLRAES